MSAASFADPLTARLVAFVRGIGIDVRTATLPEKRTCPVLTCCAGCADHKGILP
jgi:hypothetical protein